MEMISEHPEFIVCTFSDFLHFVTGRSGVHSFNNYANTKTKYIDYDTGQVVGYSAGDNYYIHESLLE